MQSTNPTLKELFEGEKEYRVPLYQRLYVWNVADQWGPLWEDITSIASALMREEKVTPHFFGALVLKKSLGITPADANSWRVIDGQQRLTTLQLLMAAVADELTAGGNDPRSVAQLKELIQNPDYAWPDRRYKMRHGGNNYARFRDVMSADGDEVSIRKLGGVMADCYIYFRDSLRKWFQEEDLGDQARALTEALRTKLQAVAIYLEPEEPEHMIFETLNARGAPLTEWDKIRNYLFYRVQEDQDGFFRDYLARFDKDWWREVSGSGQDSRPRTDRFVDYWLESRFKRAVSQPRVFREFREWAGRSSDDDLIAVLGSMTADADYYSAFEKDDDLAVVGVEALFHQRRRWMRVGAFWPLLFGVRLAGFDNKARDRVLSVLESWLLRRWICGYPARGYPDRALDLLHILHAGGDENELVDKIIGRLETLPGKSGWWPPDQEFMKAVGGGVDAVRPSPPKARLVLEAIERHITSPHAEKQVSAGVQVEHLMPLGWKEDSWPLQSDDQESRDRRDHLIQTLGNLTLVLGPLNAEMSNGPWLGARGKRQAIDYHSSLMLNRRLLKQSEQGWDEDSICKRGEWMARVACEIWPHAEGLRQR